jgi:L-ascorbate oxidase
MCTGTAPLRVERDEVVDIVVQARSSISGGCDLHPWHLHGHTFWMVGRGAGLFNATAYTLAMAAPETDPSSQQAQAQRATADNAYSYYSTATPLEMDTVSAYPSDYSERRGDPEAPVKSPWGTPCGWVILRVKFTNPGMINNSTLCMCSLCVLLH